MNASNKRKLLQELKTKIKSFSYLNYSLSNILFPAFANYFNNNTQIYKNKKNIFNFFCIHYFKEYESLLNENTTYNSLLIKSIKRDSHNIMYEGYVNNLNLNTIKSITQNLSDISYKIAFPNFSEILFARKILKLLNINSLFLFTEILYCLKRTRELDNKINLNISKKMYIQGDYNFPNIVLLKKNEMKFKNLQSYTFQFFNLSQDNEFKSEQESFWLNSQVKNIYVWGKEYKKFLETKLVNKNIIISSHPLYSLKTKKNKVTFNKNTLKKHLVICLNPPEKININYEFISLIQKFCDQNDYTYSFKLHPIDTLNNYLKYINHKRYLLDINIKNNVIYLVNNSTIYFDLIIEGKIVLRYKHEASFLNLLQSTQDFFTTSIELKYILDTLNIKTLEEKKRKVEKNIFNI